MLIFNETTTINIDTNKTKNSADIISTLLMIVKTMHTMRFIEINTKNLVACQPNCLLVTNESQVLNCTLIWTDNQSQPFKYLYICRYSGISSLAYRVRGWSHCNDMNCQWIKIRIHFYQQKPMVFRGIYAVLRSSNMFCLRSEDCWMCRSAGERNMKGDARKNKK